MLHMYDFSNTLRFALARVLSFYVAMTSSSDSTPEPTTSATSPGKHTLWSTYVILFPYLCYFWDIIHTCSINHALTTDLCSSWSK